MSWLGYQSAIYTNTAHKVCKRDVFDEKSAHIVIKTASLVGCFIPRQEHSYSSSCSYANASGPLRGIGEGWGGKLGGKLMQITQIMTIKGEDAGAAKRNAH